jgi:putative transposase
MRTADGPRKKVRHFDLPGDAHYLTFSCYRGMPLLSKDRTRIWFLEELAKAREKHRFDLWAWVIMPEHVHLLIYPRERDYETDKILASIKKPVSFKAIQFLKELAPEFLEKLTVRNRNRTYHRFWQAGPGYDGNLNELEAIYKTI